MFPTTRHRMEYVCTNPACQARYPIEHLLYTCPACGGVFLLEDIDFEQYTEFGPAYFKNIFQERKAANAGSVALSGIFRFYELMAPVLEEQDILCLGEGNTPIVEAPEALQKLTGLKFAYKNEGQNPSASFKDRGMAGAYSYIKSMVRKHGWDNVLCVCASTGDTSAAAAMYGAYVGEPVKTVVLLPQGKVTPEQLAQPLGNGALVVEVPGVFDDCMKLVELLAEQYPVALLNSKNAWRILGQESYAYEVAEWYNWDMAGQSLFVPIGNAGNISAIMSGLLKLKRLGILTDLPAMFGVQSERANPVWRYYSQPKEARVYEPVKVRPSVAQAAMIGNPVSFPRVQKLVAQYEAAGGFFHVIEVQEQAIMDAMLVANRHGHIACTQGGECLAGLMRAKELGLFDPKSHAVLDATAHSLKFALFQNKYYTNALASYSVDPRPELQNTPISLLDQAKKSALSPEAFTQEAALALAARLSLQPK